jgi:branched-chain amino acid transport system permease protein
VSLYVQSTVSGLLIGGLYALMALGFSVTWGLLRTINLAHFALILLGAYATYQFSVTTGIDPFLTLFITVPLFFLVGVALQLVIERFEVSVFNTLLITFGLFIIAEGSIRNVWGADFLRIPSGENPYAAMSMIVGTAALRVPRLIALIVALVLATAGALLLYRSYIGKALRAVAEDREMAAAFGIDQRRVSVLLAGIVGASAAIAGALVAVGGTMFPSLAEQWIGLVFAIVILGGVGSPTGALAAALLVGAATGLATALWGPSAAPLVAFLLLIAVLLWRPYGLFGRAIT